MEIDDNLFAGMQLFGFQPIIAEKTDLEAQEEIFMKENFMLIFYEKNPWKNRMIFLNIFFISFGL